MSSLAEPFDLWPTALKFTFYTLVPLGLLLLSYQLLFHPLREYPGPFLASSPVAMVAFMQ
ncbi:hypothetical protein F5Y08DRAFT_305217 [Xylaria arbuscula]|nr:hypothetical protein F5Y08DRAFT_305217 [Xylaria arbuscula]